MANHPTDSLEKNMRGRSANQLSTRMSRDNISLPDRSEDQDVSIQDIDLDEYEIFIETDVYDSLRKVGEYGRLEVFALTFLNNESPEQLAEKVEGAIGVREDTYLDWFEQQRNQGLLNIVGDRTTLGREFSRQIEGFMSGIDTEPQLEGIENKMARAFTKYLGVSENSIDVNSFDKSALPDEWLSKARAKQEYQETMNAMSSLEGVRMPLFEVFIEDQGSYQDLKHRYQCFSDELGLEEISTGNFANWINKWEEIGLIEEVGSESYSATKKGERAFEMASSHAEAVDKYQDRLSTRTDQLKELSNAYDEASKIDSLIREASEGQREYLDFSEANPRAKDVSSELESPYLERN